MLEKIKTEDWSSLETLNGSAEHVPNAVLELLTDNKEKFDKAYWKLENHVVVQGDLYSSAAVLPKYLEEVVIKARFKPGVLELLFQIGNGHAQSTELEEKCFSGVIEVLKRLLIHPEIAESSLTKVINEDLEALVELHEERHKGT